VTERIVYKKTAAKEEPMMSADARAGPGKAAGCRHLAGTAMLCFAIGALAAAVAVEPALAQPAKVAFAIPYTGTLKRINDSGEIRIGYRENSPPFAFLDARRKPVGYSLDLCENVVEEIVAELGRDLRVIQRPVTPENRFDLVAAGDVDLECGSTTNNVERRKIAGFSPTIFVTGTKLLVRRGSGILNFRDLAGRTVVLTRGTVHETAIPKLAQRQNIPIKFVFGNDHGESFRILAAGKADAFANDDVQLYGMVAETKSAADFRVVGDFLTYADYALMFRKDDPEFAEVVERAFHKLAGSREIVAVYERWFQKALPSGARLNMPMSPHLEELYRVQGLPSD
jgi:glutamate/aspartate transport system substrate-binding protein